MSLSMMKLFTRDELCAVIGHELGHFRGDDTLYSLRFAPAYARLSDTLANLASGEHGGGAGDLARLPALHALMFCWIQFASAERTVGRERELLADKAGVEAANARACATALTKFGIYASLWDEVVDATTRDIAADARAAISPRSSSAAARGCTSNAGRAGRRSAPKRRRAPSHTRSTRIRRFAHVSPRWASRSTISATTSSRRRPRRRLR